MTGMKVGIIGLGSQAKKIVKATTEMFSELSFFIYMHRKGLDSMLPDGVVYERISALNKLKSCNAVIVASPNEYHTEHIKALLASGFGGYILCEKPPAQSFGEIEYLENLPGEVKNKIFFNFNYRRSIFFNGLRDDAEEFSLGRMISVNIITGHGLGLKECYKNSWRASREKHPGGVFETVSIHFIDMLVRLFGAPLEQSLNNSNLSPLGDSIDNSMYACCFANDVTLCVMSSYTTPFISSITVLYENGLVVYDSEKKVCHPRDTFDENNLFTDPPVVFRENISRRAVAGKSLKESLRVFFEQVMGSGKFSLEDYNASLNTNRIILEALG